MAVAPAKSSITLLTPDRHQHDVHPVVTIHGQKLPLVQQPKILGVTYDPHLTFTSHINEIIKKANQKLNVIKHLTGTSFGQQKSH